MAKSAVASVSKEPRVGWGLVLAGSAGWAGRAKADHNLLKRARRVR